MNLTVQIHHDAFFKICREYVVPHDSDSTPIMSKMQKTMTVTHEIAHQWFGNLVSPAWWKYQWLSEGMSTYLKFYITDKVMRVVYCNFNISCE